MNWKLLPLALVSALLVLSAGCGGLNASGSVSPATFFLPGLMKADPPPAHPERTIPADETVTELAQF